MEYYLQKINEKLKTPKTKDVRNGITGYGKYCVLRMRNPNNLKKTNPHVTIINGLLTKIVDFLSIPFGAYEDIYSIIDFLPDVIALDIAWILYRNAGLNTSIGENWVSPSFQDGEETALTKMPNSPKVVCMNY